MLTSNYISIFSFAPNSALEVVTEEREGRSGCRMLRVIVVEIWEAGCSNLTQAPIKVS